MKRRTTRSRSSEIFWDDPEFLPIEEEPVEGRWSDDEIPEDDNGDVDQDDAPRNRRLLPTVGYHPRAGQLG